MPEITKEISDLQAEDNKKKKKNKKSSKKQKSNLLTDNGNPEKNSILFYVLTVITALLLVALIIGGTFFFAIKKNVNGIADNMRGSIEKVPILSMALPPKPKIDDEKNMTEEQVRKRYTEIKNEKADLEKQITELKTQLEAANKQLSAKDTNSSLLQKQKDELEKANVKLETEKASLKKDFDGVSAVIAKGDTTQFKNYFEKLDPKVAADLYKEILTNEKMSDDVKKYISIYESMDAGAVAGILEQMGKSKMTLIVDIMKNLKKDTSGAILSAMTPAFAAQVSEQLANNYNVGTSQAKK